MGSKLCLEEVEPGVLCGQPSPYPRCPEHGGSPRRWPDTPMPPGWTSRRARQLKREPNCRVCGAPATDVDHIIEREDGGSEEDSNLQSLCRRHHDQKTHASSMARRRRGGGGR